MLELRDLEIGQGKNEREPLAAPAQPFTQSVFMDVTIRRDRGFLGEAALAWSLIPIPWLTILLAIVDHRVYWLFILLMTIFVVSLTELILKPWFAQPRPETCAHQNSFGMPSGHSLCAGLLFASLTLGWRAGRVFGNSWMWGWVLLPVLYVPVPWARWKNGDHTWQQSLAGFILGLVLGFIFYPFSGLI